MNPLDFINFRGPSNFGDLNTDVDLRLPRQSKVDRYLSKFNLQLEDTGELTLGKNVHKFVIEGAKNNSLSLGRDCHDITITGSSDSRITLAEGCQRVHLVNCRNVQIIGDQRQVTIDKGCTGITFTEEKVKQVAQNVIPSHQSNVIGDSEDHKITNVKTKKDKKKKQPSDFSGGDVISVVGRNRYENGQLVGGPGVYTESGKGLSGKLEPKKTNEKSQDDVVVGKSFTGMSTLKGSRYVNCTFSGMFTFTHKDVQLEHCVVSGMHTFTNGGTATNCKVSGFHQNLKIL